MTFQEAADENAEAMAVARRFTILDAMILVGVTSVGLAWNRWAFQHFSTFDGPFDRLPSIHKLFNLLMWNLVPHLALWSLAILVLGLRGPRAPFRAIVKRPGMSACSAASMAILFEAAWYIPFKIGHPGGVLSGILIIHECERVGFAVGGAWLVLMVGTLWKSEMNWIDRAGRVLGFSWIAVTIFFNFRNLFL
jgi:hypothetical protein